MTDRQSIFDEDVPTTTTEGVSPEAPAPAEGPARDDAGRFVAKDTGEATAADPAPAQAAPPAAIEREPVMVPLAVALDDREKRQRADSRVAELERQIAALQQQQQPEPALPDPIEDASGFGQFVLGQVQQATMANRLNMSRFLAEEKYGAETVEAASAWLNDQPDRGARFLSGASPWHAAVAEFQQAQAAAERMAPDYETRLRASIEAELRAKILAEHQAAPPSPSPRVPPSMARAGSSGREPPPAQVNPIFT